MGPEHVLIERVARYLAGRPGASGAWPAHLDDAASLLALIQQPDAEMTEAGDVGIWIAMVDAALRQRWTLPGALAAPEPSPTPGNDEEGESPVAPEDIADGDAASWVAIDEKERSA